jgi:sugar O-acyltransferase (sialic acid O-acetyltransferase NeuD family)
VKSEGPIRTVIYGTGKFGEVAHYYLDRDPGYEVSGFTADEEYIERAKISGVPVVPSSDITEQFPPNEHRVLTAVAYSEGNRTRTEKYRECQQKGYDFVTYVDPNATVADNVSLGENCFIFEENVVQPFVDIGDNVIMWSGNHIGHHSTIERNTFISSHVVVSGNVQVGQNCFLGVNATVSDGISIGEHAVVGANALLIEDAESHTVYGGQPASVLRHLEGEDE